MSMAKATLKDPLYHCPECGSDLVFSTHEQAFMLNGGYHYCHMVKTHDPESKAGCLACNWRGERRDIKEQS